MGRMQGVLLNKNRFVTFWLDLLPFVTYLLPQEISVSQYLSYFISLNFKR